MGSIVSNSVGDILDNYADVIEGGNTYNGGTVYRGIPGTQPSSEGLRSGADSSLTVAAVQTLSTTTFDVAAASYSWPETRWVDSNLPPFFALCTTSGASGSPNLNRHRKVTGYNDTTKIFTIAPALDYKPIANDVFSMLQGFKRLPNQFDIEADDSEIPDGFDRFFSLGIDMGEQLEWSGKGRRTFKTELVLKLRLLKWGRMVDAEKSAFENMVILSSAMTSGSPDHRESTYTRALYTEGRPERIKDDRTKIVLSQNFTLIYCVDDYFV